MFTSAFRGFGALQACAAYEQQMDEVAKAVGSTASSSAGATS